MEIECDIPRVCFAAVDALLTVEPTEVPQRVHRLVINSCEVLKDIRKVEIVENAEELAILLLETRGW